MAWAGWLGSSAISGWIAEHEWVVPLSQSVHIIGVAMVFTAALLISFRLLGVDRSHRSLSQLVGALRPWLYAGLIVLAVTGTIQVMAEPGREFVGDVFWWKMGLIAVIVPLTIWFVRSVARNAAAWDTPGPGAVAGRAFGAASLLLWLGIVFCGRFIAYTFSMYA